MNIEGWKQCRSTISGRPSWQMNNTVCFDDKICMLFFTFLLLSHTNLMKFATKMHLVCHTQDQCTTSLVISFLTQFIIFYQNDWWEISFTLSWPCHVAFLTPLYWNYISKLTPRLIGCTVDTRSIFNSPFSAQIKFKPFSSLFFLYNFYYFVSLTRSHTLHQRFYSKFHGANPFLQNNHSNSII
jgi:hypothetical protein